MRLFGRADGARLRAPLWLGVAFETGGGAESPCDHTLVGRVGAIGGIIRAAISRFPAARDLSGTLWRSSQYGFRTPSSGRLRRKRRRRGFVGAAARYLPSLVWRRRRLQGVGRAERRRFSVPCPDRSRVHAAPAAAPRVCALVRSVPAQSWSRRTR